MIVVTGATGNIGRTLVPLLTEVGEEVVAVSRQPQPAGFPAGVRHARADVGNAASMRPVLDGAEAFFILLGGELNGHGESPKALLDAAGAAGVKRVVLLSSQINSTRPDALSHARLREFEAAVHASGVDFTILRPGGFASNAFAWAEPVRTQRTVFAPFADVALPVIDPADIAEVASVALREDGHAGRTYELTGPEAISPSGQAAVISEALGEEVALVELSRGRPMPAWRSSCPRRSSAAPWTSSASRCRPSGRSAPTWRTSSAVRPAPSVHGSRAICRPSSRARPGRAEDGARSGRTGAPSRRVDQHGRTAPTLQFRGLIHRRLRLTTILPAYSVTRRGGGRGGQGG